MQLNKEYAYEPTDIAKDPENTPLQAKNSLALWQHILALEKK